MDHSDSDVLIDALLPPAAAKRMKALRVRQAKDAASAAARANTGDGNAAGQIMALAYELQHASTESERTAKHAELMKISQRADVPHHLQDQAAALANSGGGSLEVITRAEAEAKIVVDGVLRDMGHDVD